MRKLEVDVSKGTAITSAKDLLFSTDMGSKTICQMEIDKDWVTVKGVVLRVFHVPRMQMPSGLILLSDKLIYSDIHIGGGVYQVSLESSL